MRRSFVRRSLAVLTAAVFPLLLTGAANAVPTESQAHGKTTTWFVESLAPADGQGTRNAPFNTLVAAENASDAGDRIVILRSPAGTPPLDGGIQLKANQTLVGHGPKVIGQPDTASLPRIANTTARLEGDAVRVAPGAEVKNLRIVTSQRGAIYGLDAGGVKIIGNDVTDTNNARCDTGGHWTAGAIMLDASEKVSPVLIEGNMVRDIDCNGEGISLRGQGTGAIDGESRNNTVTRVRGATAIGIGAVARGSSEVSLNSYRDTVSDFGNPVQGHNEAMYGKVEGDGLVLFNVDRAKVGPIVGTSSTNGLEIWVGPPTSAHPAPNRDGQLYSTVTNSIFFDNPHDALQMNNTQGADDVPTDVRMSLTLENVVVRNTTAGGIEPPFSMGTSQGDCMNLFNGLRGGSVDSVMEFTMINSTFENCSGDGIHAFTAVSNTTRVKVIDSTIADSGNSAIHYVGCEAEGRGFSTCVDGTGPLVGLDVEVEGSRLSGSGNWLMQFNQTGPRDPAQQTIDLEGGNCFIGGDAGTLMTTGFDVLATSNWWGSADGPEEGAIFATSGTVTVDPVLTEEPRCGANPNVGPPPG